MTPQEKEKIRLELEKKIAQTKQTIEGLEGQTKPVEPDRALGRLTRMDAIQQKEVNEANLRSAKESLINLEEALKKLDEGSFGVCQRCKKNIPIERILAIPETRSCIDCSGRLW